MKEVGCFEVCAWRNPTVDIAKVEQSFIRPKDTTNSRPRLTQKGLGR